MRTIRRLALLGVLALLANGCASYHASLASEDEVSLAEDGSSLGLNGHASKLTRMGRDALPSVLEHAGEEERKDRLSSGAAVPVLFRVLLLEIVNEDKEWGAKQGWGVTRQASATTSALTPQEIPEEDLRVIVAGLESVSPALRNRTLAKLETFHDPRTFKALVDHLDALVAGRFASGRAHDHGEIDRTMSALHSLGIDNGAAVRVTAAPGPPDPFRAEDFIAPWGTLFAGGTTDDELRFGPGEPKTHLLKDMIGELRAWLEKVRDRLPAQVESGRRITNG